MNSRRSLLLALAFLLISVLIYQQWQIDYHMPKPVVAEQAVTQQTDTPSASPSVSAINTAQTQGRLITVKDRPRAP